MFSRLVLFCFALSALVAMVAAEHHPRHGVDEIHKRAKKGKPSGRGGQATWYKPGQGNCGGWNGDNDMIIALPTKVYDKGQYCNKRVKITNTKNQKTCYATVVDSCPGCGNADLDVSPKVFKAIAKNLDQGVATINWDFA